MTLHDLELLSPNLRRISQDFADLGCNSC